MHNNMPEEIIRRTKKTETSESFSEGALEGFPVREKAHAKRAAKQQPEPVVREEKEGEEDIELLPSEEEYVRLQTLHLQDPEPFPFRTSDVRQSMFDKLKVLADAASKVRTERLAKEIPFYAAAKKLFTRTDDPIESADLYKHAERLYRDYVRGHDISGVIQNIMFLLNIHHSIALRIGNIDLRRYMRIAAALIDPIIVHHDVNEKQLAEIQCVVNISVSGTLGIELKDIVLTRLRNYVQIRTYADGLKTTYAENHESLADLQPELEQMGNDFMNGIRNLRRYGVKSSYYQDHFLHDKKQAWVLADIRDVLGDAAISTRGIFALISLAQKDSIEKAGMKFQKTSTSVTHQYASAYSSDAAFFLKWDGELHDANPDRHLFVREVFKRAGAEAEYEMLRVAFLARIHDLVVPLEHTRTMPPLDDLRAVGDASRRHGDQGKDIGPILRKVFLPRIRGLSDPALRAQLEREHTLMLRAMREHDVKEHDVKEFVRTLPVGHHPSPEAVELARMFDIILDPKGNETFVRPHTRGKGGTGFLHELKEK